MPDAKNTASGLSYDPSRLVKIRELTIAALEAMSDVDRMVPEYVESEILTQVNTEIDALNGVNKGVKWKQWKPLTALMPSQIADVLIRTYPIVRIAGAGKNADEDQDLIGMYQFDGPEAGTYVTSHVMFRKLMRKYNYALTMRDAEEVLGVLQEQLPRVTLCRERNLIAVNNGIFDYDTKQLLPFDPKKIFLTKSHVDYNPNAKNVIIHNDDDGTDWDVESWMNELSDDPEIVNVLWQTMSAVIRPNVSWNKSAWFYSETGNNGKGTLCELMRQLCGEGSYASIPLSDFGKDFMLEPLLRASSIIVDENDVGTFIDKAANLKAVITGDTLSINRKFKTPVAFNFRGFMVQCLNEMPRIKDRSDSFFRRQLFVPFTKCFTGAERKYIKNDYLHRKEVLEYVLHKVLHSYFYELAEPEACKLALEEYKDFVDPVRSFLTEFMPRFKWDLLPTDFLYDLYKAWYKETAGNERSMKGKSMFVKEVKQMIQTYYHDWEVCLTPAHPSGRMDASEPLIFEYNLDKWKNPVYHGTDIEKICHPILNSSYRAIRRVVPNAGSNDDEE